MSIIPALLSVPMCCGPHRRAEQPWFEAHVKGVSRSPVPVSIPFGRRASDPHGNLKREHFKRNTLLVFKS